MYVPDDRRYTEEHEWVLFDDSANTATIGITDYAQGELGDIVFVELPEIGRTVEASEAYAVVESVKAVSDIYAPVAGEIIEVNEVLEGEPEKVNTDPYGAGWIAKVKMTGGSDELMSDDEYTTFLEE